jgi:8-oxo-dGTP pyrophosphatase MutT (NUDIX family)
MELRRIFSDRKKPGMSTPETPSLKEIEQRLKAHVPQDGQGGDHMLNPGMKKKEGTLREAAVLILLVKKPDGSLSVIFTERTTTLTAHAGQISFPGGGVDKTDKNEIETALREASEEIGLDVKNARVLGQLEDYVTRTGYRVRPVVAVLETQQEWQPQASEVAKIFEVPLAHILSPKGLHEESLTFEGGERRFFACDFDGQHIWGATAGMLKSFANAITTPTEGKPGNDNPAPPKNASKGP